VTAATLRLPNATAEQIIAHARATYPRECCGLLAGDGDSVAQRFPITNIDQSNVFYVMEPREQFQAMRAIDEAGWCLLAIYHSHPDSEAYPSVSDVRHACYEETSEAIYPDTFYLICSLADKARPVLRAFLIRDAAIEEASVLVESE
jgi:proteasome lid subunit RPN8/RPN11